jgi:uncharacterized protein YodC (DUF2158 family)
MTESKPAEFKIGDVVQVKASGPRMTVEGADSAIRCVWWSESAGDYHRGAFPAQALELVKVVK